MAGEELFNIDTIGDTIAFFAGRRGVKRPAVAVLKEPSFSASDIAKLKTWGVTSILYLGQDKPAAKEVGGIRTFAKADAVAAVEQADLIVVYDLRYWDAYQEIGVSHALRNAVMKRDLPVVPYARNAWRYPLLPAEYLEGGDLNKIRLDNIIYQYISRSNLRGSYAEFGTWFGRSFYRTYLHMNEQLDGEFWAFDSFGGLPPSKEAEVENTKGDFAEGRYFCNEGSFRAIGELLFPQDKRINERIKLVKGFYEQTLDGHTIADYGIKERSISYCCIDCDLYDSTLSVLRFIEPALQDGSVLFLDDYRMSRAAKGASLYHAVKVWLAENPGFDLLDLHRDHWQHQYVIFNRY